MYDYDSSLDYVIIEVHNKTVEKNREFLNTFIRMNFTKTVKKNLAIVYFLGACYCSLFLVMDGFYLFHSSYTYLWKQPLLVLSLTALSIGTIVMVMWSGIFHDDNPVVIEIEDIDNSIEPFKKEEIIKPPRFSKDELLVFIAAIETDSYLDASANDQILSTFCKKVEACQAAVYLKGKKNELILNSSYCLSIPAAEKLVASEGLTGQVLTNHTPIFLEEIPQGFMDVVSGLGECSPSQLSIIPALSENEKVEGIIEIAVFKPYTKEEQSIMIEAGSALVWKMSQTDKH